MADTSTVNYGFTKPGLGSTGWATKLNNNFDAIDSSLKQVEDKAQEANDNAQFQPFTLADIATMLRALALPFEYGIAFRGKGTFNSTVGTTISLPITLPDTDCYTVNIMPIENSGFIGEIWVEKANNSFTVYCTGSENSSQFEYTVLITEYLNNKREG